jgi:hypothetical protein
MTPHTRRHTAGAWISLGLALLVIGCTTTKEEIFPKDMSPMTQIYDQHFDRLNAAQPVDAARTRLHQRTSAPVVDSAPKPATETVSHEDDEWALPGQDLPPPGVDNAAVESPSAVTSDHVPNPNALVWTPAVHAPAPYAGLLPHDAAYAAPDYTRSAQRELDVLFPWLPNPALVMYVYPHLAEGSGVPGYATQFRMYPVDEVALPGEVPPAGFTPLGYGAR